MLIEVTEPLTVRLPEGVRRLEPCKPTDLSKDLAKKLFEKAPGKVKAVRPDWLTGWQHVADLVYGVTVDDPRMLGILAAIQVCDRAYEHDDWAAFQKGVAIVQQLLISEG